MRPVSACTSTELSAFWSLEWSFSTPLFGGVSSGIVWRHLGLCLAARFALPPSVRSPACQSSPVVLSAFLARPTAQLVALSIALPTASEQFLGCRLSAAGAPCRSGAVLELRRMRPQSA
jgi:hypothetical protein